MPIFIILYLSTIVIASFGHARSHPPQPMQIAALIIAESLPIAIAETGQLSAHTPHIVHRDGSIWAFPKRPTCPVITDELIG
jgi:hypothetical protein